MTNLTKEEKEKYIDILTNYLQKLRKELQISQKDLAARTGISANRISLIENGKIKMNWSQFTSFLFIFSLNSKTKNLILRKNLFPMNAFKFFILDEKESLSYYNRDVKGN